jgi:hypothetical protein
MHYVIMYCVCRVWRVAAWALEVRPTSHGELEGSICQLEYKAQISTRRRLSARPLPKRLSRCHCHPSIFSRCWLLFGIYR